MSSVTSCLSMFASGAFCVVGCATGGQAWVQQPENALAVATATELGHMSAVDGDALIGAHVTEPNLTQPAEAPRHRLDHVVSLGEGAPSASAPASNADPIARPTPVVVVNIVNHGAPAYGYGEGYYPAHAYRTPLPGQSHVAPVITGASPATPSLGHDWQAPPSYGPTFPYHTGPASPWERARR